MAKKRKKKKATTLTLSPDRYQKLLLILLEAWESAKEGQAVYWDLGPGERPQKISDEFLLVAKREKIPLKIQRGSKSLTLLFPEDFPSAKPFRVLGKDGEVLAEGAK